MGSRYTRLIISHLCICTCVGSIAQQWDLVRSGWKYNYGLPGDIINSQILIAASDTLGPGVIQHHFNMTAAWCDTCTVQLQTDIPQFLQRSVIVENNEWHFMDPGSLLIIPDGPLGSTWLMDTAQLIFAEVTMLDSVDFFGVPDVHKTITCSNGDEWKLSQEWGILQWNDLHLLGIHGPDVGTLIPTIHELYPYGIGDVVEYDKGGHYGFYPFSSTGAHIKYTILDRTDSDTSITFDTWRIRSGGSSLPTGSTPDYFPFSDELQYEWNISPEELPYREMLFLPPGSLVTSEHQITSGSTYHDCISRHGRDSLGRYIIECDLLIDGWSSGTLRYTQGIGLEHYTLSWWEHYNWLGSVIAGDTAGTVHSDEYLLSTSERTRALLRIYPNPASEFIFISDLEMGPNHFRLHDLTGKLVHEQIINGPNGELYVSGIPSGTYLLFGPADRVPYQLMIIR